MNDKRFQCYCRTRAARWRRYDGRQLPGSRDFVYVAFIAEVRPFYGMLNDSVTCSFK
jgi:hypothetical protein